MAHQDYRQLILEGIDGLPPELLAEITYFVHVVRRRARLPLRIDEPLQERAVGTEAHKLSSGSLYRDRNIRNRTELQEDD
ncbi:MAG: hypothetical protein MI924_09645 [Chloroflexales bacterium]|nr:hypothetical protein [Chloroflexales bacterium]